MPPWFHGSPRPPIPLLLGCPHSRDVPTVLPDPQRPCSPDPPIPQCSHTHLAPVYPSWAVQDPGRSFQGSPPPAPSPAQLLLTQPRSLGKGLAACPGAIRGAGWLYLQEGDAALHVLHELLLLGAQGRGEQRQQQQQAAPGPHGRQRCSLQLSAQECSGLPSPYCIQMCTGREGTLLLPRRPAPGALTPSCPSQRAAPEPRGCGRRVGTGWGQEFGVWGELQEPRARGHVLMSRTLGTAGGQPWLLVRGDAQSQRPT